MPSRASALPQAALLRVLLPGEAEAPELMRKIRDWTQGRLELDAAAFAQTVDAAERAGLIERHEGPADKRTGAPHVTWSLTAAGRASAVEILADSLIRKG
jgi:DNA-binding MarR family transcriptional regulator